MPDCREGHLVEVKYHHLSCGRHLHLPARKGIATTVLLVVVVIVIAVGAVGGYLALTSGGGSPASSTHSSTTHASSTTGTTTKPTSTEVPGGTTSTHSSSTTAVHSTTTTAAQTTTTTGVQSCSTTYTSGTGTQSSSSTIEENVIPLFQHLSNMTLTYSGASGGSNFDMRGSYAVQSAKTSGGITTYKVDINFNAGSGATDAIAWVQSNGNVIAIDMGGQNLTAPYAESTFLGFMSPFITEGAYMNQLQVYAGSIFQSSNQGTKTIGTVTLSVTEYTLKNTPQTFSDCGTSGSLNEYQLDLGQVQGTSYSVISYLHLNGTVDGQTTDMTIQVTWLARS